jgi:hypothetical protein
LDEAVDGNADDYQTNFDEKVCNSNFLNSNLILKT